MERIMLKDVCDIFDGPHATPQKTKTGPVYLGIDAITEDGRLDETEFAHLSVSDYEKWTRRVTPIEGDIVFSYEATLGRYAIIPKGFYGCLGRRLAVIRNKSESINTKWLYYYFRSPEWKAFIARNTVKGSTVNRISVEDFPKYTIPLVEREQQDLVAKLLGMLDEKIATNDAINDNLTEQAKLIFDKMFPSICSGEKHIGDYVIPKRGTALLSKDAIEGEVPVIAGGIKPSTYNNQANTQSPVITISASGANAGFINLWSIPVWSSDSSFIDTSSTPYVYFWYEVLKRYQQVIFSLQSGSAQPHIYPNHIANLPMAEVDLSLVREYEMTVSPLFSMVGQLEKESIQLGRIRDCLLPILMNGQATISD